MKQKDRITKQGKMPPTSKSNEMIGHFEQNNIRNENEEEMC